MVSTVPLSCRAAILVRIVQDQTTVRKNLGIPGSHLLLSKLARRVLFSYVQLLQARGSFSFIDFFVFVLFWFLRYDLSV